MKTSDIHKLKGPGLAKKASVKASVKILALLGEVPDMTLAQVAVRVNRTVRAVEMAAAKLVKEVLP